jgi:hypothetical protein
MDSHIQGIDTTFVTNYVLHHQTTAYLPARRAFREAAQALYRALMGNLPPALYLVGVDCGGGKSTFIKAILRSYKQAGFKPDTGILVALPTLKGVDEFANGCGLGPGDFAVFTNDRKLNAYGRGRDGANEAPILFTTQQMAWARMERHGSLSAVEEFHYNGKPRLGKIWDESLDAAQGVAIPLDTLRLLPNKLRKRFQPFVAILDVLLTAVDGAALRTPVAVPSAIKEAAAPIIATLKNLKETKLTKDEAEVVRRLNSLAAQTVGIERGMHDQRYLLGVVNPLPADFMPALVFDASIRVRDPYRLMEQHRKNIVRLPVVEHCYAATTIHLCKVSTGSDKLAEHGHRAMLLAAAAELINADADDDWLVIHHMAKEDGYDIAAELKALLNHKRQAVFVHWGDHLASNDYREIRKVIVIGTWRKPEAVYAAQLMASSGLGYDAITPEDRRRFRLAEQSHDLMQAVGRSNIRNAVDGLAGEVEVYLFASSETGLEDRICGVFPGCKIVPWEPVDKAASGHLAAVMGHLHSSMVVGSADEIRKKDIRAALTLSTSQGLRNVTKDKRFQRFLTQAGIRMERNKFVRERPAPV